MTESSENKKLSSLDAPIVELVERVEKARPYMKNLCKEKLGKDFDDIVDLACDEEVKEAIRTNLRNYVTENEAFIL